MRDEEQEQQPEESHEADKAVDLHGPAGPGAASGPMGLPNGVYQKALRRRLQSRKAQGATAASAGPGQGKSAQAHAATAGIPQHVINKAWTNPIVGQPVGTFTWTSDYSVVLGHYSIPIHACQTVNEWRQFINTRADEQEGSVALNAFMALALGAEALYPTFARQKVITAQQCSGKNSPAVQASARALMTAMLTSSVRNKGHDMDLGDVNDPQGPYLPAANQVGQLLADFTAKYLPGALKSADHFNPDTERGILQSQDIQSFVSNATDVKMAGQTSATHTLIASALGTFSKAAITYMCLPDNKAQQTDFIMQNAAVTMGAAVKTIKQQEDQKKSELLSAYHIATEAVTLIPEYGELISLGMTIMESAATSVIDALVGGTAGQIQNALSIHVDRELNYFMDKYKIPPTKAHEAQEVFDKYVFITP